MALSIEIKEFDDGHQPALAQNKDQKTLLAYNLGKSSSNFLSVYDDLIPLQWAERIYEYAVKAGKPWGVYVLTKDLLDFEEQGRELGFQQLLQHIEILWESDPERAFAMCATYALVMQRGRGLVGRDVNHIHGTAVWCLCSGITNSVEYHIDYAELYRYETNTIHPPLYAGTCQLSPFEIKGGSFCVNTGGISHYKRFGYKAKLNSVEALHFDLETSSDWHTVRYKYNRGILHDGDLPHLSTPVEELVAGSYRVVLGFNCFTSEVGECCIRAPEHSQAFNRTVKLYQAIAAATGSVLPAKKDANNSSNTTSPLESNRVTADASVVNLNAKDQSRISAKEILKNPALARLIVLAAKKVKAGNSVIDGCLHSSDV